MSREPRHARNDSFCPDAAEFCEFSTDSRAKNVNFLHGVTRVFCCLIRGEKNRNRERDNGGRGHAPRGGRRGGGGRERITAGGHGIKPGGPWVLVIKRIYSRFTSESFLMLLHTAEWYSLGASSKPRLAALPNCFDSSHRAAASGIGSRATDGTNCCGDAACI